VVLLQNALAARGVAAEVDSAGLGESGFPATDPTASVAARRGLDLADHESQRLTADLIAAADLVLGMERLHVREAVLEHPLAWPRTFTLKELVRRGEAAGERPAVLPLDAWIARAHEGRQRRDLLGGSGVDDLSDPTGGTLAEHEDLARELETLVDRLVEVAWPTAGK
jgi:protein-tyrosine phosphatase